MGLSICRSIVDAHGGRRWIEANEPCGAVFQFTLPGAQARAMLRQAPIAHDFASHRIALGDPEAEEAVIYMSARALGFKWC